MAKKKRKPKKAGGGMPRGFSPSGLGGLEGMLRNLAGSRGKRRLNPLAIAQELADAAWEAARPQDQVELAQQALSVSADCADAYVILANQAPSRQQARQLLEEGVAAGARAIGTRDFETAAGHFWLDIRTRPYMRARLGLAQCLWESGQRSEAAEHFAEMLQLNPSDNQGIRYLLLGALIELGRDVEAQELLKRYERDSSAEWLYTAALLAFRREGDSDIARNLLNAAAAGNRYVPQYLVGNKNLPPQPPSYVSHGGEDEAVSYVAQFLRTWRSSPGAIPWLRKTLKVPLPRATKPRKPNWSLFRHTFLRLPKVDDEVWQLDVCRLPAAYTQEESGPPWALVLWNRTQDAILSFDAGEEQPTLSEVWEALVEALLRPRPAGGCPGEPHLPAEIQVRRKTFHKAWHEKLRQIDVDCRLYETLDGLDGVMENLLPTSAGGRRILEGPEDAPEADLDDLAALPQNMGETWQADVRRLPGWLEQEGELRRPWASLVTNRDEPMVLAQNLRIDSPPAEWIWKNVADAMFRPMTGEAHRPGIIEVAGEGFLQVLHERLETIGVRCVLADDLEQVDEVFRQLGKFLSGGKAAAPLLEVPGIGLDDIRSFYAAAADFYRAAPWRLVPGDTTLKIECPKFRTHTWYGVVMGQSGLVLGLALYEDLEMLQRLFTASDDEQMSRQAAGLSVMFGEAFESAHRRPRRRRTPQLGSGRRRGMAQSGPRQPRPFHAPPAGLGAGVARRLPAGGAAVFAERGGQCGIRCAVRAGQSDGADIAACGGVNADGNEFRRVATHDGSRGLQPTEGSRPRSCSSRSDD